jgi:hypothetical protein
MTYRGRWSGVEDPADRSNSECKDKETPAKSPHSVVSMYEDSSITLVCHKPDLTDRFPFKESG